MSIDLIAKIAPKNAGFRGMVDGDQVITTVQNQSSTPLNLTSTSGNLTVLCDATSASITVNLPTAVSNTATFTFKKVDSSANTVTVDGNGTETIEGSLTAVISVQYVSITIVSNNTNWSVI